MWGLAWGQHGGGGAHELSCSQPAGCCPSLPHSSSWFALVGVRAAFCGESALRSWKTRKSHLIKFGCVCAAAINQWHVQRKSDISLQTEACFPVSSFSYWLILSHFVAVTNNRMWTHTVSNIDQFNLQRFDLLLIVLLSQKLSTCESVFFPQVKQSVINMSELIFALPVDRSCITKKQVISYQ